MPKLAGLNPAGDIARAIKQRNGVTLECLRPVGYDVALGVWPDRTEHGWEKDDRPHLSKKVRAADIPVSGASIGLGEKTSVCMHLAGMIIDIVGIPAHGNQCSQWEDGCRSDFPNLQHR